MIRLLSATNKLIQMPDPSVFSDIKNFLQTYNPRVVGNAESSNKEAVPGQPSQPIIYDMFENFPQPFENRIEATNALSLEKNLKKKKSKSHYKPRNIGSGGKARTSKSKNFTSKTRSKTANVNVSSNDKKALKNNEVLDESSLLTPEEIAQRDSNAFSNENECYNNEDFEDDRSVSDIPSDNDQDDSDFNENNEDNDNCNKTENPNEMPKPNPAEITHSTLILNESSSTSNTSRFNKDFVKSFEDKVFAIYSKYDNLIDQQTHKLDNKTESVSINTKNHLNTQLSELNEQKAQFSDEIARELSENVNFEEISSNPELVKRLKELYSLVKKNGSSSSENKIKVDDELKSKKGESNHDSLKLNQPRKSSPNTGSLKTNQADIREVFSIVNSMNSKQTKGDNSANLDEKDDLAELTIPRMTKSRRNSRVSQDNQIIYNGFSGVSKNATLNTNKFKLPFTLSDKINTLMENKLNIQKSKNSTLQDQNHTSDEGTNRKINESSNLKFNYVIKSVLQ
jgi:hypothetical protein